MSITVFCNEVRTSHLYLFQPAPPMPGAAGGPKFGGQFIMAPESKACKDVTAAFMAEAQKVFGPNFQNIIAGFGKGQKCLRNGNTKLTKEGKIANGYEGMMFISAKNKLKPLVISNRFYNGKPIHLDENGKPYVDGQLIDPGFPTPAPYSGCYVNAKIEIYALNKGTTQGVYANLLAVQFCKDGEAFGGGMAPTADGFGEVAGFEDSASLFG